MSDTPSPQKGSPQKDSPPKSSQQLLVDALKEIKRLRSDVSALRKQQHMPIAVIGMSCRFPGGATSPDAFWQMLKQGQSGVSEIGNDRWNMDDLYDADPQVPGKLYSRYAGMVQDIEKFDAELFGISPVELQSMDPQHRVFLEAAWSCIENAGIAPAQLAGTSTGVYVGIGTQDFSQLSSRYCSQESITPWGGTGVSYSAIGGRLSYLLDLRGPAVPVDTACSSSLVALHQAVQGLRRGESDAALVGGVMLMINPATSILFCKAMMLSPDGKCKTFDAAADGYVRGEGCGVVMLKRLDDALRDGDNVLALIRGTAVNQDGRTQGLTAPNESAQVDVIRRALRDAEATPADVSYIEAHGTGTSLGDPIEMSALATAYCTDRAADNTLWVGSLKTNVGHMEAAAGVGALEKVILSMQHDTIAPHINFENPSKYIDWAAMPQVQIPRTAQVWNQQTSHLAGISSFGFTGTNAHVIVEQAPAQPAMTAVAQAQLFKLSGQRMTALRDTIAQQAQFIAQYIEAGNGAQHGTDEATAFARLCYTANRGRNDFRYRLTIVANDSRDLQQQLQQLESALDGCEQEDDLAAQCTALAQTNRNLRFAKVGSRAAVTAWMFTGQGSQYPGMAKALYEQLPIFRAHLDDCTKAFALCRAELPQSEPTSLVTLTSLLWGEHSALLSQTQFTQPALFAVEYALARVLLDSGLQPAALIGHSVGEYAAACVAGVFDLNAAMKLVCARGELMQRLIAPGAMLAVMADLPQIEPLLALHGVTYDVTVCAKNAPQSNVVGGSAAAIDALQQQLKQLGIRCKRLDVSHAFHTPMMQPMLAPFTAIAQSVNYRAPRFRFYSSVSGKLESSRIGTAQYWVEQISACVDFSAGLQTLLQTAPAQLLEIGPDRTLCGLARQIAGDEGPELIATQTAQNSGREFWLALSALYCGGHVPSWTALYRGNGLRPLQMPGYVFQREVFWHPEMPRPSARQSDGAALRKLCYQREWVKKVLLPSMEARPAQGWLLFAERDVAATLPQALQQYGQRVTCINAPTAAVTAEAMLSQLQTWLDGEPQPAGIVMAWHPAQQSSHDVALLQHFYTNTALYLLQALQTLRQQRPSLLTLPVWFVVTDAAQRDAATIMARGIWGGIINVVALEQTECLGGFIESDVFDAEALALELLQGDSEDQIRYHAGQRSVARLRNGAAIATDLPAVVLNPQASYLVTGGLGSLGLGIAQWLADNGAKHIVLLSRGGESSDNTEQQALLQTLRTTADVSCPALDVGDKTALAALFDRLDARQTPVRGVVHAAGMFDLTSITELDAARCDAVMGGKIQGAWHLHELTATRALDFFVLFSSIASVWGSAGNFHYAAANHVLDIIALLRRDAGLPVVNINWGPWSQSTMAQHNEGEATRRGLVPLQPTQGFALFDQLLRAANANVLPPSDNVIADVVWSRFLPLMQLRGRRPVFDGLATINVASAGGNYVKQNVLEKLRATELSEQHALLCDFLAGEISQAAGLLRERFDNDAPLLSFGLDSLMALELRNRIRTEFELDLPVTLLLEGASTADIAAHLLKALGPAVSNAAAAGIAAPEVAQGAAPHSVATADAELEMLEGEL